MRRFCLFATVTITLVAATFPFARARVADEQAANASAAWEYRVFLLTDIVNAIDASENPKKVPPAVESRFNALGRDRCEFSANINGMAVFKRPKL